MKIGELAAQADCSVETIRYYEREGLLAAPGRSAANYRQYDDGHLARLRFIRRCRALDMSHEEVRALLALQSQPGADCDGVNACVDAHIQHVEARIKELQALLAELQTLRNRCPHSARIAACGILDALNAPPAGSGSPTASSASCGGRLISHRESRKS